MKRQGQHVKISNVISWLGMILAGLSAAVLGLVQFIPVESVPQAEIWAAVLGGVGVALAGTAKANAARDWTMKRFRKIAAWFRK